jgi:hypothetical protein
MAVGSQLHGLNASYLGKSPPVLTGWPLEPVLMNGTSQTGGWMGPEAGLNAVTKKRNVAPCTIEFRPSNPQ